MGDSFPLVTYAQHTGQFGIVNLPALADSSLTWEVDYGPSVLSLRVVPEDPASVPATGARTPPFSLRLQVLGPNPTAGTTTFRFGCSLGLRPCRSGAKVLAAGIIAEHRVNPALRGSARSNYERFR